MGDWQGVGAGERSLPERLARVRAIELALAALVSGGALFTTFVNDATSQDALSRELPTPTFDVSQFAQTEASAGSRAAVAAALSRSSPPSRLLSARDYFHEHGGAGRVNLTPEVSVQALSASSAPPGWSGSALGVQVTASTRALGDLPPVFLVGGAGRETYMIAPYGPLNYTLAPSGAEASVGDAHIGVGVEVTDKAYLTVGYVREQRRYSAGAQEWSEDEHFVGIGLRARW